MEVQPDIQQRSGLDQASSWEPAGLPSDTNGLQLIQRSGQVGQHCLAQTHLHLLLVIVICVSTSG
jgi:hypothetical protein